MTCTKISIYKLSNILFKQMNIDFINFYFTAVRGDKSAE